MNDEMQQALPRDAPQLPPAASLAFTCSSRDDHHPGP